MNIIFLSEWLAKKAVKDFTISEKMIRNFEKYLTYIPKSDPTKISLTIEQAIMTYFMVKEIERFCGDLLSEEEDKIELSNIIYLITKSTQELRDQYPNAFEIIACDLADTSEKQGFLKVLP